MTEQVDIKVWAKEQEEFLKRLTENVLPSKGPGTYYHPAMPDIIKAEMALDIMRLKTLQAKAKGTNVSEQESRLHDIGRGLWQSTNLFGYMISNRDKQLYKDNMIMALSRELETVKSENEKLKKILETDI